MKEEDMLERFIAFVFRYLAETGIDANTLVKAFAEEAGITGLRPEYDLRHLILEKFKVETGAASARPVATLAPRETDVKVGE